MVRPVKKGTILKDCEGNCKRKGLSLDVNFYVAESKMFKDGRIPICKKCIKAMVDPSKVSTVRDFLRQVDKPFIEEVWDKIYDPTQPQKDCIGLYLRQINSLHQYKGFTYDSSTSMKNVNKVSGNLLDVEDEDEIINYQEEDTYTDKGEMIKVTPDIIRKWGSGYTNRQYIELEQTWTDMCKHNKIETSQHKTELKFYCKLVVKRDMALENDQFDDFSKLSQRFNDLVKNAGFRPIDKVSGTDEAGMRSFSHITEEIEKDGFIEPVPYDGVKQDIVDKTIMYLINYQLKLHNTQILITPPSDTPKIEEEEEDQEEGDVNG